MEDTTILVILAITLAFYYYFKASKLAKEIELRDELIASQKALMEGQLAENDKEIKWLQELQEQKEQERLQKNPKEQECVTSYKNINDNLQESEDVRALVREFVNKAPIINKYSDEKDDDRARKILQQLRKDEQTKNEAIEIIEDFNRWFMAKQSVTVAEANQWDRAQYLSFLLMKPKPMTWAELAEKSPEEQHRYSSCWKTVIY
ncbi:hypothetical protein [Bartonella tribocorum]|uniref:Uncharacterized protein n=1 Tax=Bartonella tribocorum TaxID=85701 RepID=A0A2M6UUJ3_9HYPH|nr:hypothetical protein [Bartonella tribocorum]PIT69764.1 hypothetical protein CER18_01725 [Bartonella tribocorum]